MLNFKTKDVKELSQGLNDGNLTTIVGHLVKFDLTTGRSLVVDLSDTNKFK